VEVGEVEEVVEKPMVNLKSLWEPLKARVEEGILEGREIEAKVCF
jgi:hypothetical protein